ncbi:hypothetical protein PLICRDRAFT_556245 [Plicaturopsis crispa FD-325 SS-3]|nr:hypothetical protein PLICRDRAFT_556245 [Plicaturopsis crispa FD-325 SS-3]
MNSIYFPVHVVAILRRLVNILSTLSLSNQYLVLNKPHTDSTTVDARTRWRETLNELRAAQYPWRSLVANSAPDIRAAARPTDAQTSRSETAKATSLSSTMTGTSWYGQGAAWPSTHYTSEAQSLERPNDVTRPAIDSSTHNSRPSNFPNKNPPPEVENEPESVDIIHRLMEHPALFDPIRTPRYPIVLCHGLYGFDVRGPSSIPALRLHYWSNVLDILKKKVGADVIVTAVPGTGSIASRAESMDRSLQARARGRGVNFLAHSMGGLDCRHLITHVKPTEYAPLSLTTVSTPHRGSPFMDWCAENIGIGKLRQQEIAAAAKSAASQQSQSIPPTQPDAKPKPESRPFSLSLASLPSSFTTLILSVLDSPAYANLTTAYLNNIFNPATPDDPHVKYFSVAARMGAVSIWHPFWLPKMVIDAFEERTGVQADRGNDGLVTVQSAQWGEFLGTIEGADHWQMRGARGIDRTTVDLASGALGIGGQGTGDGWSIKDWGKFVGAWKKQERQDEQRAEAAAAAASRSGSCVSSSAQLGEKQAQDSAHADAIVKASTDKMSAVFDWLADQVPAASKARNEAAVKEAAQGKAKEKKNELATKMDLERFYVAMSRKLYDEGL